MDRLQIIVVAKSITVLQLFISRMPKMCAIPQLVSAPLNPIPTVEHFRRSHPHGACHHSKFWNLEARKYYFQHCAPNSMEGKITGIFIHNNISDALLTILYFPILFPMLLLFYVSATVTGSRCTF